MNILFICTANRDRSKTAEHIFRIKYPDYNFMSAGINQEMCLTYRGVYVEYQMCLKADKIYCMENLHAQYLLREFGSQIIQKIEILEIEDNEEYMSDKLIKELELKFKI